MNKKLVVLLAASQLFANDASFLNTALFQVKNFKDSLCSPCPAYPYGIQATADGFGKAKRNNVPAQNIRYAELEVDGLYGIKTDGLSGFTFEAGYGAYEMKWQGNPFFSQSTYNYVNLGILAYTGGIDRWFWQVGLGTHLNEDHGNGFLYYARSSAFFWGRYTITPCAGFHIGTLTLTGIRKTTTCPIVGFDWTISKHWQLNAIFPINMNINYVFNEKWYLGINVRPFISRQRVGNNEPLARGIWEYTATGTELQLVYDWKGLAVYLFGGTALSSKLKVTNWQSGNATIQKFGSAPYAGFSFLWAF